MTIPPPTSMQNGHSVDGFFSYPDSTPSSTPPPPVTHEDHSSIPSGLGMKDHSTGSAVAGMVGAVEPVELQPSNSFQSGDSKEGNEGSGKTEHNGLEEDGDAHMSDDESREEEGTPEPEEVPSVVSQDGHAITNGASEHHSDSMLIDDDSMDGTETRKGKRSRSGTIPSVYARKGDDLGIPVKFEDPVEEDTTLPDSETTETTYAPAAEESLIGNSENSSHPASQSPPPHTTSPTTTQTHTLSWAVSAEQGYRNGPNNTRDPIHPECEDVWAYRQILHPSTPPTLPSHIFILADGHGGISAGRFFVSAAEKEVSTLLLSRTWDFSSDPDRRQFTSELSQSFQVMDAQYASRKVEEYRRWIDGGSKGGDKPVDDGCTLVVNVLHGGWIVNVNVGDSRTVIAMRKRVLGSGTVSVSSESGRGGDPSLQRVDTGGSTDTSGSHATSGTGTTTSTVGGPGLGSQSAFHPIFTSEDHNMLHPMKVYHIHRNGGQFVSPTGTLKTLTIHPPHLHPHPYIELATSRIYRPLSPQIKAVGVSHRRTLNLTATMGDLLFKIEPSVMSCVPDVSFVEVVKGRDCVIVMGTDGVWDHLRWQGGENVAQKQGEVVLGVLGACVDLEG
ncbi:hypothetical protein HK097_008232, partial [Rhizophlyctis rosea]